MQVATISVRRARRAASRVELARHHPRRHVLVYGGLVRVRFRATNELGAVEVTTKPFRVIRAAPVQDKQPKKQTEPRG